MDAHSYPWGRLFEALLAGVGVTLLLLILLLLMESIGRLLGKIK